MYKVILVDDEILILNGLKSLINWTSLELTIEDTALNGAEAFQKFQNNPVDIVITDITMPEINGLELIKKIKAINKNTKFIILSGYDDFNYAKEAISIGIENYILKPINEQELESTLKSITEKLNNEVFSKSRLSKDKEILRNNIFYRWINNNISVHELEEREFLLDINLNYEYYTISMLKLGTSESDTYNKVYNYIREKSTVKSAFSTFNDYKGNIILLWGMNDLKDSTDEIKEFLEGEIKNIVNKFNTELFITQGSIENSSSNAFKSYKTAKKLQEHLLIKGYNKVVSYYDFHNNKPAKQHMEICFHDFQKIILSKNIEAIDKYIGNIFDKISAINDINPEEVHNVVIRMLMEINKIYDELNIPSKKNDNLKELILETCTLCTVNELREEIRTECRNLVNSIQSVSSEMSPVIKQILLHIKEHYYEEMSLKTLGNKYNINPFYLGQIFHKEVGENFSEYINRIKNEKAKELLLTSNLKVSEIAKRVGYTDNSYFYRRFKDFFGVSPNSLRESKNF